MVRRLLPLLLLALAAGCAQTGAMQAPEAGTSAPVPSSPPPPPDTVATGSRVNTSCQFNVTFASFGAGIDNSARERVEALLVSDRRVIGFDTSRWGREGEVTLCVRTRSATDAAALFREVRTMVPSRPRGPIRLSTIGGLQYETPLPR